MRAHYLVTIPAFCVSAIAQGGLWTQLTFPIAPAARYDAALVYDSARDRDVLIGGVASGGGALTETWENDGNQWVLRGNFGPTSAGGGSAMRAVYDSVRMRTVAVLSSSTSNFTQTWEWDGTSWQQRTSAQTPPGRFDFAMAFDSARGRTVLFGGKSGLYGPMSDTWEWDGTNWVQRASGGPQARQRHAMAFDSARGVTVLFGGHRDLSSYTANFGDTWEWNGSYWVEAFGVLGPAARSFHSMAFDSARHRVVLCGGRQYFGSGPTYVDTWEWNGLAWTNMQAAPPASLQAAVAFDALRQRTILFGGMDLSAVVLDQTWAYATPGPVATVQPYGSGCPGPNGLPLLAPQASSLPRLGSTFTTQLSNLPSGPLNVPLAWLGFDNTSWNGQPLPLSLASAGFPGCQAHLAPAISYVLANAGGTATWSLAIPFLPAMAGADFYLQGGVVVLGFNPGGVVFTGGLHAMVGR